MSEKEVEDVSKIFDDLYRRGGLEKLNDKEKQELSQAIKKYYPKIKNSEDWESFTAALNDFEVEISKIEGVKNLDRVQSIIQRVNTNSLSEESEKYKPTDDDFYIIKNMIIGNFEKFPGNKEV